METSLKKTRTSASAKSPLGNNNYLCELPGTLSEEDPLCRTNQLTKEIKSKQLHRVTLFNGHSNIREAATALGKHKTTCEIS